MYHSILLGPSVQAITQKMFGTREERSTSNAINTWDDWHLIPSSRPVISPPAVKTKTVEIPGADGDLDLTEILGGVPLYKNRSGSIDFFVQPDWYNEDSHQWETWDWVTAYQTIMGYLHGQRMYMVLEDDPGYFYSGRFSVNSWKSDKNYSQISINYEVYPFKRSVFSSTDDWLWDPFDFETGYINDLKQVTIAGVTEVEIFGGTRKAMILAKATPVNSNSENTIKVLSVAGPMDETEFTISSSNNTISLTGQPAGSSAIWVRASAAMTLTKVDGVDLATAESIPQSSGTTDFHQITSTTLSSGVSKSLTFSGTGTLKAIQVVIPPVTVSTTSYAVVPGMFIQNGKNKVFFIGNGTVSIDYRGEEF